MKVFLIALGALAILGLFVMGCALISIVLLRDAFGMDVDE